MESFIRSLAILFTFLSSGGRSFHVDIYEFGHEVWRHSVGASATIGNELLSISESALSYASAGSAATVSAFTISRLLFFVALLFLLSSLVVCAHFIRQFNMATEDLNSRLTDLEEEHVQLKIMEARLNDVYRDREETDKELAMKIQYLQKEQISLSKWLNFHVDMFNRRLATRYNRT